MDNQWLQQISYCLLGLHPHLTAISNWLSTSAAYIAYRHIGNCGSTEFQKPYLKTSHYLVTTPCACGYS